MRGPLVVREASGHLFFGLDLPLREEAIAVYFLAVCAPCFAAALASSAVGLHLRERGGARRALGTLPAASALG